MEGPTYICVDRTAREDPTIGMKPGTNFPVRPMHVVRLMRECQASSLLAEDDGGRTIA